MGASVVPIGVFIKNSYFLIFLYKISFYLWFVGATNSLVIRDILSFFLLMGSSFWVKISFLRKKIKNPILWL